MCSPELTKGMCCICFGTLADDNIYIDDEGQRWDFHKGVCALLAGVAPAEHRVELDDLARQVRDTKNGSPANATAIRAYYGFVDSIAIEDFYDHDLEAEQQEEQYALAMMTCPYYQYTAGNAEMGTCRNGCWEEPACVTGGPFDNPPGWTDEMLTTEAARRAREERGPV